MASSSSELTLDLMPAAGLTPATVRRLVEDGAAGDGPARRRKMEECVRRLEEERRKIAGFRRELPLCMLLVSDAIDALKLEVEAGGGEKKGGGGGEEAEKMSWLVSAQLWSGGNRSSGRTSKVAATAAATATEMKQMAGNGALAPFNVCSAFPVVERKVPVTVPDLSLRAPLESGSEESGSSTRSETGTNNDNDQYRSTSSTANLVAPGATSVRKPRRSWSPDLHRRFVSALGQLGGPHVATPKQIREVMEVEGLTNDEVKSHLQKYRLHAKRASTTRSNSNQPVVLFGGVWPSCEPFRFSKASASQSGSPQSPFQLVTAGRAISNTAGDSGEEEDGKSESYNWKGHLSKHGEDETA